MKGSIQVTFAELFRDTVETHGLEFAREYYCTKHGMSAWEFGFWAQTWIRII